MDEVVYYASSEQAQYLQKHELMDFEQIFEPRTPLSTELEDVTEDSDDMESSVGNNEDMSQSSAIISGIRVAALLLSPELVLIYDKGTTLKKAVFILAFHCLICCLTIALFPIQGMLCLLLLCFINVQIGRYVQSNDHFFKPSFAPSFAKTLQTWYHMTNCQYSHQRLFQIVTADKIVDSLRKYACSQQTRQFSSQKEPTSICRGTALVFQTALRVKSRRSKNLSAMQAQLHATLNPLKMRILTLKLAWLIYSDSVVSRQLTYLMQNFESSCTQSRKIIQSSKARIPQYHTLLLQHITETPKGQPLLNLFHLLQKEILISKIVHMSHQVKNCPQVSNSNNDSQQSHFIVPCNPSSHSIQYTSDSVRQFLKPNQQQIQHMLNKILSQKSKGKSLQQSVHKQIEEEQSSQEESSYQNACFGFKIEIPKSKIKAVYLE